MIAAKAEDDKPYDPFDEDYEMDSSSASSAAAAAQVRWNILCSSINEIYIAPLQGNYSEALPAQDRAKIELLLYIFIVCL